MFKIQRSKLMVWLFSGLVLPSPLGFLSPGNGGIEGGVKTIEGRGEAAFIASNLQYSLRNLK